MSIVTSMSVEREATQKSHLTYHTRDDIAARQTHHPHLRRPRAASGVGEEALIDHLPRLLHELLVRHRLSPHLLHHRRDPVPAHLGGLRGLHNRAHGVAGEEGEGDGSRRCRRAEGVGEWQRARRRPGPADGARVHSRLRRRRRVGEWPHGGAVWSCRQGRKPPVIIGRWGLEWMMMMV